VDHSKFYARARTLLVGAIATAAVVVAADQAFAQGPKMTPGERAVKYRQAVYTVLAGNFGPVNAMATGKAPMNAAELTKRSERVAQIAKFLDEAFPPESNGVGNTDAKPEIWTNNAEFQKQLTALVEKSDALAAAAKTGDAAKIKSAAEETAGTCKSCHEKFMKD